MRKSLLLLQSLFVLMLWQGIAFAAVGRTQGTAAVSDNGAAEYTIPIFAPVGIAGLTPELAFTYSSNGGNGALGVGWSISGLSRIERCPAIFASNNGNPRDVKGDALDRFCLDGNQLKYFAGAAYGQAGAEYRTEIDTVARIKSYGAAGTGPAYFIVEQKDGLIYEYGNSTDSRIEWLGTANIRAWAVNKIRDRAGNALLFNYSEDGVNGGYRISSLQYTSNTVQGIAPGYDISFVYEAMPSGEVDSGFMGDGLIKRMTRLDRVDVNYNGNVVRRYDLTFESALSSTSRSRLQSIQECAGPAVLLDCYPATTFTYQNGTNATSALTGIGVSSFETLTLPLDVNGDGRTDVVYANCEEATGYVGTYFTSLANANGTFGVPKNSQAAGCLPPVPIDYNADGLGDILIPDNAGGSTWIVSLGSATGLTFPVNTNVPVTNPTQGQTTALDVTGDGVDDVVWVDGQFVRYRAGQVGSFSVGVGTLSTAISGYVFLYEARRYAPGKRVDFNGDGREDVLLVIRDGINPDLVRIILSGATPVEIQFPGSSAVFADLNGDGLSDVVYGVPGTAGLRYRFSRGLSIGPEIAGPTSNFYPGVPVDYDGDGFDDLIAIVNQQISVARSTGEAIQPYVALTPTSLGHLATGDVNGDGLVDVIQSGYTSIHVATHLGAAPDLLLSATDGFGVSSTFSYASTGNSTLYQRLSGSTYPTQEFSGPMYVVSNVQASNGIGGTYNLQNFTYEGARVDRAGRGLLGFAARTWVDSRTGVMQRREYRQDFPLIGQVKKGQSTKASTNTLFEEDLTLYQTNVAGATGEQRYLFNASSITQTDRELGGTYNGSLVRTQVTTNVMDFNTGTVYDSTTVITEAANANGLNPSQTHTQRTYAPLANLFTDTANWCIGRPTQVQQIGSHTLFGGGSQTRTVSSTWDGPNCRMSQTVVEPGNATLQVTTDLTYDGFGNLSQQSVTPINEAARVTTVNYGTDGRFPLTITNPLSQATNLGWSPNLGLLNAVQSPNVLTDSTFYDAFGRVTVESQPDGTSRLTEYMLCDADCTGFANTKYKIRTTFRDTTGGTIWQGFELVDAFDRTRRVVRPSLEGAQAQQLVEYNAAGQVFRTSNAHFNLTGTPVWTTFLYDSLGRKTQATRDRVNDNDASTTTATIQYDGLSITSTDPQGKVRVDKLSPLGQVLRAIQGSGTGDESQASYDYDAFGNLVRLTDAASNQSTFGYNVRGFKTSSSDVDLGNWIYSYSPVGELKSQTDAKSQVTTYTYDKLERPLTRVEPADSGSGTQTTTWTWGNSAASFNIGQLRSIALGTYSETYTYDNRGRLASTSYLADGGTYVSGQSYNSTTGLLETVTYPASTGATPFKVKYEFETANKSGLLQRVKDFNAGTVFWQATSTNALGQYQDITLGNGLKTLTAFDTITGTPNRIETGPAGGNTRQNLQYVWDKIGNLASRRDLNISKLESFTYDNLYRLTQANVTGGSMLTVAYNAIGNITNKSDVGAYTYNATKKHAVASAGTFTFTYDANGNAITQNGATLSWTAYNLPKLINKTGGNNSTFLYTPDRERYKQVAVKGSTTETTLYIGAMFEKLTRGGAVEYKHSVFGPESVVAIHNRKSTGVNETIYPLQDHLGSTDVITNASGASLVKLSYTAFGARRNGSTWSGAPSAADLTAIGNTTHRGFTDQEHLDNLDLIHFNGRVYHPAIGRFISADPIVQDAFDTQSLNRYSYVLNNPLTFTDPSGFFCVVRVFTATRLGGANGGSAADNFGSGCPSGAPEFDGFGPRGGGGGGGIFLPRRAPPRPPRPQPEPQPQPQPQPQPDPTMGPNMPNMIPMPTGQVTRNTGEAWMQGKKASLGRTLLSVGVGFVPVAGSIQSIVELVSGRDYITGEETSRLLAAAGVVAGLVGAKGLLKGLSKADDIAEGAVELARKLCCFVAGTLVMTETGLRPIEEIAIGDFVLSRDEVTGETMLKPVMELIHREDREIWEVTFAAADHSKAVETFSTTDDHPWRTADGGWLTTEELLAGTLIQRASGEAAVVLSVFKSDRVLPTFNLEVDGFHTYFVGEFGVWVHNSCKFPRPGKLGDEITAKTRNAVIKVLTNAGFTVAATEKKFERGAGALKTRFADVFAQNSKTGETLIVNIGLFSKRFPDVPIKRELSALADILSSPTLKKLGDNVRVLFIEKGSVPKGTL